MKCMWTRDGPGTRWWARAIPPVLLAAIWGCASAGGASDSHAGHDPGHMPAAPAPTADHAQHHHALPATAGDGYTVDDVHFMQMMIGHHDQALRMAALVEGRGAGPEVTIISRRIDISQKDEIDFMERWLRERGQAVPDDAQRRAMEMPGMVTDAQFAEMEAARGTEFDRLFLRYMIAHHLGALEMVDELFRLPGAAQDTELFPFVTDVGADQLDEIGIMERILTTLDGEAEGADRSSMRRPPHHFHTARSPRR
jgi:uncharacterized protein (DUF305 family)